MLIWCCWLTEEDLKRKLHGRVDWRQGIEGKLVLNESMKCGVGLHG